MIDALLVPTYRTLDTLTIITGTSVFNNWCVIFCNSAGVATNTNVCVMSDHGDDLYDDDQELPDQFLP